MFLLYMSILFWRRVGRAEITACGARGIAVDRVGEASFCSIDSTYLFGPLVERVGGVTPCREKWQGIRRRTTWAICCQYRRFGLGQTWSVPTQQVGAAPGTKASQEGMADRQKRDYAGEEGKEFRDMLETPGKVFPCLWQDKEGDGLDGRPDPAVVEAKAVYNAKNAAGDRLCSHWRSLRSTTGPPGMRGDDEHDEQ